MLIKNRIITLTKRALKMNVKFKHKIFKYMLIVSLEIKVKYI